MKFYIPNNWEIEQKKIPELQLLPLYKAEPEIPDRYFNSETINPKLSAWFDTTRTAAIMRENKWEECPFNTSCGPDCARCSTYCKLLSLIP